MGKTKTKKPTGLSLARDGKKFTAKWTIADKDYDNGQNFQYRVNSKKWKSESVGKSAKTKTFTVNPADYYPKKNATLSSVSFRIRGNRKKYTEGSGKNKKTYNPTVSDWSTKSVTIKVPRAPSVSVARNETLSNVASFSWSVPNAEATSLNWFTRVEWQSILVKESNVTDGKKLTWNNKQTGWQTGTGGATGSKQFVEESELLAASAYTRWFRIRSQGPKGANGSDNGWSYSRIQYARPYQAIIKSVKASRVPAGGYLCTVKWEAASSAAHPISFTTVQYAIEIPAAGMKCPDGASWQDANVSADTGGQDAASFSIDDSLGPDQCLFVRVNTTFAENTTYGMPKVADTGILRSPENLSVQTSDLTYRATITANNISDVPDSFLVVLYCTNLNPNGDIVGIIPHGETSTTVQCANWSRLTGKSFKVYAAVGSYKNTQAEGGISSYSVTAQMKSATISDGGVIPTAPANLTLSQTEITGTIRATWEWSWEEADSAEITWSDHADAWESTDEPSEFIISNLNASSWNISNLETGITWYVRVRLISGSGDNVTYGPYSDMVAIDLSSAPVIPVLALSAGVITPTGEFTASWVYVTTDGTGQGSAQLAEVTTVNEETVYTPIADLGSAQSITLSAQDLKWQAGESHALAVKVVSASGRASDGWSEPVTIMTAEEITAAITQTSLIETEEIITPATYEAEVTSTEAIGSVNVTAQTLAEGFEITGGDYDVILAYAGEESGTKMWNLTDGMNAAKVSESDLASTYGITLTNPVYPASEDDPIPNATVSLSVTEAVIEKITALKSMPLTLTVTGAGPAGTTIVVIERAEAFQMDRPDESQFNGYEGETIAIEQMSGEGEIEITLDDLIGHLDDDAAYRIIATVQDSYGQSSEASVEFVVAWEHQAIIPEALVTIDEEQLIALLTPIAPEGTLAGDTCDIYRLSADKPQLIVEGATFGTTYVDPYPAIGEMGGHRFVFKTENGDYITEDKHLAWLDTGENEGDILDLIYSIVNFGTGRVELLYDSTQTNQWSKDFTETQYLGGAVQGDWNPAISMTSSVEAAMVTVEDQESMTAMRRLGAWPGVCHLRTVDGSSYPCDIQVSESRRYDLETIRAEYSLSTTKVDPEELEGMTLAEWDEIHQEEE